MWSTIHIWYCHTKPEWTFLGRLVLFAIVICLYDNELFSPPPTTLVQYVEFWCHFNIRVPEADVSLRHDDFCTKKSSSVFRENRVSDLLLHCSSLFDKEAYRQIDQVYLPPAKSQVQVDYLAESTFFIAFLSWTWVNTLFPIYNSVLVKLTIS